MQHVAAMCFVQITRPIFLNPFPVELSECAPQTEQAIEELLEEAIATYGNEAVKACQFLGRQRLHHPPRMVQPLRAQHRAHNACRRDERRSLLTAKDEADR